MKLILAEQEWVEVMTAAKAVPVFLSNHLLIHPAEVHQKQDLENAVVPVEVKSLDRVAVVPAVHHKEEKDHIKGVTLRDVRAVVHHQATHLHQIPVIVAVVLVQVGQVQAGPALAVPVLVQEMAAEGADKNEITQTNNQRGEHGKRI